MSQAEIKSLFDLGFLFFFTIGVVLTSAILWNRLRQYRQAKWVPPYLLWRDLILFNGLAIPFLVILLARALGLASTIRDELIWSIITGTPAVVGVWFWLGVELFGLSRRDDGGSKGGTSKTSS